MNTISKTYKAYAKVNLALDVLRRRPDGYHDVKMIMQNLSLCDELTFTIEETEDFSIELTANKEGIPTDERNLIYRAIKLMADTYKLRGKVKVDLIKNIPVEAGMAGGSTDCAAAFHAMNDMYELKLPVETLMKLGVTIGADVPYCILAKTAVSEGIGEVLTPITPLKNCYVLVAKPPVGVSTAMVYKSLVLDDNTKHPDVDGMRQALDDDNIKQVAALMDNVLATVTENLYPVISEIKEDMKKQGAINAIMSGSGPTVFGLYEDKEKADAAAKAILDSKKALEVYVTTPV